MKLFEQHHVQVYRYCVTLACGDEPAARAATGAALRAMADQESGEDDPAALFTLARAAVKAELRQRRTAAAPRDGAAGVLFAARPALDEQHWSLLALVLPEYADRPRHRQVDLTAVAAALGRKLDVTRKAVDRLVEPGGYLDVAMFTAGTLADGAGCPDLAAVVTGAKRLRPALRKAVAAHLADCATCTAALRGRPDALTVLSAVPVPAAPADLTEPGADTGPAAPADLTVSGAVSGPAAPADLTVSGAVSAAAADLDVGEQVAPEPDEDADITAELLLGDGPAPVREAAAQDDRPPATVYYPVPAVAAVRLPLLRRPPVLLSILVALLAVAAGAGFLGVRSGSPEGLAGAAAVTSAAVTGLAAPPPALSPSGVAGSGSPGAGRTPAASGHAKVSTNPSARRRDRRRRGRRRAARPGR